MPHSWAKQSEIFLHARPNVCPRNATENQTIAPPPNIHLFAARSSTLWIVPKRRWCPVPSLSVLWHLYALVVCCRMVASLSNQLTQSTQPNGPASPAGARAGAEGGVTASQGGVDTALAVQAVRSSISLYMSLEFLPFPSILFLSRHKVVCMVFLPGGHGGRTQRRFFLLVSCGASHFFSVVCVSAKRWRHRIALKPRRGDTAGSPDACDGGVQTSLML